MPQVHFLRDATPAMLASCRGSLTPEVYRRASHGVSEDERTLAAKTALQARDYSGGPTSYIVQLTSYIVHLTSYIVHPTSYILHLRCRTTCAFLHLTSDISHLTSYSLHLTAYILGAGLRTRRPADAREPRLAPRQLRGLSVSLSMSPTHASLRDSYEVSALA